MVGASPYPSSSRMTSSRRPNRILLLVALFVFLVLFFTSYRSPAGYPSSYLSYSSSSTYSAPQQFDDLTLRPADRDERITLVAVYGNAKAATYLSPLLQTAAQNARSIDLLLVNVNQGGGCLDLSYVTDPASPTYAPNVKHLCLTEVENDEYYQRFICKGWKRGCDPETKATVMHHLERIRKEALKNGDEIFNTFKPWRGLVYKEHLKTRWWGWFDADQLIGNFEHLFPKDIMNNFDLILTQGSDASPKALFLSGQLTVWNNNEKMERLPYRYKPFSAPEHLHLLKPGDHGTSLDEGEYSELFINKLTEVDILRLPDVMGPEPGFGDRRIIIVDGHILSAARHISREDVQLWFNKIHDPDARGYRVGNTLTAHGVTVPVDVSHDKIFWCNGDQWNPINTCTNYSPTYAMRNLMYRKNGSAWKLRRDVRIHFTHDWLPAALEPKMFVHFLSIKYNKFFRLPDIQETGYLQERVQSKRVPLDGLRETGRKLAIVEITRDWWATWTLVVGDKTPPRGFEKTHKFKDEFETSPDNYWRYHMYEYERESQDVTPPPAGLGHVDVNAEVVDGPTF